MKRVVLYSGGLDSFCLAHLVKPDLLVYFHTGLPEQDLELMSIRRLGKVGGLPAMLQVDRRFNLAPYKLSNDTMPFRNLYFLAAGFTYGDALYLGSAASDIRLDHGDRFTNKVLDLLAYLSQNPQDNPPGLLAENMQILTPFEKKTKSQFLREFLRSDGNADHLMLASRSCYRPTLKECGECTACVRKAIAFVNNSLPLTMFENDPTIHFEEELKARSERITAQRANLVFEVRDAIWAINERERKKL